MAGGANRASSEVIERWYRAVQRVESLKQQINGAECDMRNAETAVGKHICPADAEIGEEFSMWVNTEHFGTGDKERLVVVRKTGDMDYSVTWRKPRDRKSIKAVA